MNLFKRTLKKDSILLGNKIVEVKKLTPALWKKVFGALDNIPGLVLAVFQAPKDDMLAYLVQAFDIAMDEMTEIVSLISGVDKDYLFNEVGLDEQIEYIFLIVKKNRLDQTIKNMVGLFKQPQKENPTE